MRQVGLLLCLVAFVASDKIPDFMVLGQCPVVDTAKLWSEQVPQHEKYEGVWYQHALTKNPYQLIDRCVRNEYSFDGNQFTVVSTGLTESNNLLRRNGKVYPNPFGETHLTIDYENSWAAPYVILETDYSNYACLYSCTNMNNYYCDFAFIFTRSPDPSEGYVRRCEEAFKRIDVDTSRFLKTVQGSSCPYEAQKEL